MALTQNALENRPLLQALRMGASHPTLAAFAQAMARDPSNLRKSLAKLERDGLIRTDTTAWPFAPTLTQAGEAALQGLEVAEGAITLNPNALRLTHAQLRRNPLNPRDDAGDDEDGIRGLADTIEAGELLQPLRVYRPDEDGVYMLAAGERRYLAIDLLISEGRWPADHPIDCVVTDTDPALAPFVALVENGQREPLSWVQEARAYQALVDVKGWSASKAARETGRDARTVQEMLKVMREAAPEDIEALELGEPGWTVERLRGSIRTPQERAEAAARGLASAEDEPETLPMFAEPADPAAAPKGQADAPGRTPTNREALALIELAHKIAAHGVMPDATGQCGAEVFNYWTDSVASAISQELGLVRWVHHAGGAPVAFLTRKGMDWLWQWHGVTTDPKDADVTSPPQPSAERARHALLASIGAAIGPEGEYLTPWLRRPATPEEAVETLAAGEAAALGAIDDDIGPEDPFQGALEDAREFTFFWNGELQRRSHLDGSKCAHLGRMLRPLLERLDVTGPLIAGTGILAGSVYAKGHEELLVVDPPRDNTDARAEAIAILAAMAINLLAGVETPIERIVAEA